MKKQPLALLLASATLLAEPGSIVRTTDLKDKPFLDAKTLTQLAAGNVVDIQTRQGAWMQVKTREGKTGWVKLLNIRSGASAQGGNILGSTLITGGSILKTGSSGNTVTTGVKGLSAEQIKNARPDQEELARLQSYGVSATDAQFYAQQSRLVAQSVPVIDVKK